MKTILFLLLGFMQIFAGWDYYRGDTNFVRTCVDQMGIEVENLCDITDSLEIRNWITGSYEWRVSGLRLASTNIRPVVIPASMSDTMGRRIISRLSFLRTLVLTNISTFTELSATDSLRDLRILNCPDFSKLGFMPNLNKLSIMNAPKFDTLYAEQIQAMSGKIYMFHITGTGLRTLSHIKVDPYCFYNIKDWFGLPNNELVDLFDGFWNLIVLDTAVAFWLDSNYLSCNDTLKNYATWFNDYVRHGDSILYGYHQKECPIGVERMKSIEVGIKMYPNPSRTNLRFSESVDFLKIFNGTGQLIRTFESGKCFNGDLPVGCYILNFGYCGKIMKKTCIVLN